MESVSRSLHISISTRQNGLQLPVKCQDLQLLPCTNITIDEMKRKVYEYKDRIQKEHREFSVHTQHLIDFFKWCDTGTDILFVDLRLPFAGQFVYYLQSEKGSEGEIVSSYHSRINKF